LTGVAKKSAIYYRFTLTLALSSASLDNRRNEHRKGCRRPVPTDAHATLVIALTQRSLGS
jgi:hypothetical protein